MNINTKSFKRFKQIEYIMSCFPNTKSVNISLLKEDYNEQIKYNMDYVYTIVLSIDKRNKTDCLSTWAGWAKIGVKYTNNKREEIILDLVKPYSYNYNETLLKEILAKSFDILMNIDTEIQYGITITPIIKEYGYNLKQTMLDYEIERRPIKFEYDWASRYWEYEDDD